MGVNLVLTILLWMTYFASLYFSIFWFLVFLDKKQSFKEEESIKRTITAYPLVSIVIPAYNEEDTILKTMESVLNLDYPADKIELLILDDGSTDKTASLVKDLIKQNPAKNIRLIKQKNQGKARALNNALAKLKGEFFACLDADSFVDKDTLKKMLYIFEQNNKELTIVTPGMKVLKPKNLLQKLQKIEYLFAMLLCRLMSHLDCVYIAPGPFSLYRTKTIQKLGGFDPYNLTEDQEIAYKAQCHQLKLKQCYDGYVYTIAPKTFKELYQQRNRWFKGSILNFLKYKKLFLNKNYGDFGFIQMITNITLFFLAASTFSFCLYFLVWPFALKFKDLVIVGFNIIPYLNTFSWDISILDTDLPKTFVLLLMLAITGLFLFLAHRNAKEKIHKSMISMIPYFLIYYLILSFIAIVVLIEVMLGKKQKW